MGKEEKGERRRGVEREKWLLKIVRGIDMRWGEERNFDNNVRKLEYEGKCERRGIRKV